MDHRQALSPDTCLKEYKIIRILGSGGFGIVYLAIDQELKQEVVIKEYLPNEFAIREVDQTVIPKSTKDDQEFEWGLERFLDEARALAEFRKNPNIVSVLRYFRENNTAYMVMEHAGNQSLADYLEKKKTLNQEQIYALLMPLLDALKQVHSKGIIHRDLKPANILISNEGEPVLIDFGAARQAIGAKSLSITAIVSAGYSPFEQYTAKGKQGAWTDIYSLAGVFYRCITGEKPLDATDRMDNDEQPKLYPHFQEKEYSVKLLKALDWGLELRVNDRPKSIDEWADSFDKEINITSLDNKSEKGETSNSNLTQKIKKTGETENNTHKKKYAQKIILSLLVLLCIFLLSYFFLQKTTKEERENTKDTKKGLENETGSIVLPEPKTAIETFIQSATNTIENTRSLNHKLQSAREELSSAKDLQKITESETRKKLYQEDELLAKKRIAEYTEDLDNSVVHYINSLSDLCSFKQQSVNDTGVEMKHNNPKKSDFINMIISHGKQYCSKKIISKNDLKEEILLDLN